VLRGNGALAGGVKTNNPTYQLTRKSMNRKPLQCNGVATENNRGEWVPPIPLPYYGFKKHCSCGQSFWFEENYNAHYAYKHILFPDKQ
jgi:hypothetical protein